MTRGAPRTKGSPQGYSCCRRPFAFTTRWLRLRRTPQPRRNLTVPIPTVKKVSSRDNTATYTLTEARHRSRSRIYASRTSFANGFRKDSWSKVACASRNAVAFELFFDLVFMAIVHQLGETIEPETFAMRCAPLFQRVGQARPCSQAARVRYRILPRFHRLARLTTLYEPSRRRRRTE